MITLCIFEVHSVKKTAVNNILLFFITIMEYIVHLNVHIVCKMYVFCLTYTSKNIFLIFYVTLISMCKTSVL